MRRRKGQFGMLVSCSVSYRARTSEPLFRQFQGEVRSIQLLSTRRSFFDGAAPTQTRAHRSDSQCQRISLRQLRYPATTCSTPMPRTRLWDSLLLTYCLQSARHEHRGLLVFTDFAGKWRADERTRTAYPCSLRVITQALQGVAEACKSRISKPFALLWFAACCTVLRSRWYQIGIKTSVSYSLIAGPMTRTRDLRSHNPLTPVSGRCRTLQNRPI